MSNVVRAVNPMKGAAGLIETAKFAEDFPLSTEPGKDTTLQVVHFDAWAIGNSYYNAGCEQATLLTNRNNLRAKINYTASTAWAVLGNEAFSIDVYHHGKSYKVRRAADAFSIKADRLPRAIKQFATTKRDHIKRILGSVEMSKLPIFMQLRIGSLDREGDRFIRNIMHHTEELEREYREIHAQLKQMVASHAIPGIAAMLQSDAEDDDEYGDLFGQ